jgi:hypothetical protein
VSCSSESDLLDNRLIPHHHLHDFPIYDALDVSLANQLELVPPVSAAPKCEGHIFTEQNSNSVFGLVVWRSKAGAALFGDEKSPISQRLQVTKSSRKVICVGPWDWCFPTIGQADGLAVPEM